MPETLHWTTPGDVVEHEVTQTVVTSSYVPVPGPAGDSAYDLAVDNGFVGTEAEWLDSLHGLDGEDGQDASHDNAVFTGTVTIPDGALAIADTNGLQAALDAKATAAALAAFTAWAESNLLTVGEESVPRDLCTTSATMSSGIVRLRFFTARKSETITQMRMASGGTAAGATPTLVKMCVFLVNGDGSLTLVGVTANDTTLFAATSTIYTRALVASFGKVAGQRYAAGALVVTAAAAPSLAGQSLSLASTEHGQAPRTIGAVSGQTDVPASVVVGNVGNGTVAPYAVLLP